MISRGDLTGRIFLAENVKVRQMQYLATGGVVDVDALDFGSGLESVVGAIGVQP